MKSSLKRRLMIDKTIAYVLVILCSVFFITPLLWMIATALKSPDEIIQGVLIPTQLRWTNFVTAIQAIPFVQYTINSLYYGLFASIGVVISSTLSAYAFAKLSWPGRDKWFLVMIATIVIPSQIIQIPLYILYNSLGWLDTYNPLIIPAYFAVGQAGTIFLMRQVFMSIPTSLSESARMDGASEWMIFRTIMLPLARSMVVVVGIMSFMTFWNDFYNPLLYITNTDYFPLAYGIRAFATQYSNQYNLMMAASLIITAPSLLLFFIAQRQIIDSVAQTGIKG